MMRLQARWLFALCLVLCGNARAATLEAIEYYDAALDHYFVTSFADEIAKLDAGTIAGWQRTGQHFTVFDPATPMAGASPVCRFYGLPAAGLDSHFYSASLAECAAVLQRFAGAWFEETDNAFGIYLPDTATGQCPGGSVPVYRAWNGRVDSNHRFTTDPATLQAMIAKGYIAEGYGPGPMPVAMCSPSTSSGPQDVPACVVSTSNASPYAGSTVTLTASCTNAPTAYTWTNCMSATAQCSATSASIGQVTYTVVARNSAGASAPASVGVAWQSVPSNAPKCTMARTSQTDPPTINTFAAFEVTCNTAVGSYSWNGCSSTTRTCVVRESAPGPHTYSVIARSAAGSSAPVTLTLNWVASATPPGLCSAFPSYLYSDIGSQTVRVESVLMPVPPAFAWNGAWTVSFVVPPTMSASSIGTMSSAEFAGEPTFREVTISRTPCDFRATDTTGTNGPLARQSGISNTIQFTTAPRPGYPVLTPGGTYYYSVRNYQPSSNTISCPSSPGRCDAFVESVLPTR